MSNIKIPRAVSEILSPGETIVDLFIFNNYKVYFTQKRLIFEQGKDIITCTYSSVVYPRILQKRKFVFWKSFNITLAPSRPYGLSLQPLSVGNSSKQVNRPNIPTSVSLSLEGSEKTVNQFVTALEQYLKYEPGEAPCISVMAGTPLAQAGRIVRVEAVVTEGKGSILFTGLMQEVMQESAVAAITYIRNRVDKLQIPRELIQNKDVHIHMPEGVIPKDGPSAGISMVCALISALTNKNISKDIAMTGEITIKGHVLPIGGVSEKLSAAYRSGIKKLILPIDNQADVMDVIKRNKQIKQQLDNRDMVIHYVENLDEVVDIVFK